MSYRWLTSLFSMALLLLLPAAGFDRQVGSISAATLTPIRAGFQPGRWWVEVYIAEQKGWFDKMGLAVTGQSFTNGALEIAAGAAGSWDVAGSGNIPSMLGSAKYGLLNIGVADLESSSTAMIALPKAAASYLKDPSQLKDKEIPVTTNTTSYWVANACLQKKFHLAQGDWKFLNLSPPEIDSAMNSGKYDIATIWAPYIYVLNSSIGAKVICTGKDVDVRLTSNLLVQPGFAKDHPDAVAKFLAVYEHAVAWERLHPKETQAYLLEFYNSRGVRIPAASVPDDLNSRPNFNLAEQLKVMHRPATGMSEFDQWMNATAEFAKSVGMIPSVPDPKTYITDKYMQMVQDDPQLRAFAQDGKN